MAQWPGVPSAGESVRLPLSLGPMLLEAVGYHGGAHYVALRWSGGGGGDLLFSDGTTTATGWWPPWRLLVREHPLGRAIFAGYDLGDLHEEPGDEAPHWLLCDRFEQAMWVGAAHDIETLEGSQPSELHAAARAVGAERVVAALRQRLTATPHPPRRRGRASRNCWARCAPGVERQSDDSGAAAHVSGP